MDWLERYGENFFVWTLFAVIGLIALFGIFEHEFNRCRYNDIRGFNEVISRTWLCLLM